MAKTMADFSNSLGAFYADVIATGFPVTVVVVSEFGRNVRENGSDGTDHGRGTTMFAMGKGIAGGRVLTKNWPTLATTKARADGQDLQGDGGLPRHSLRDRPESAGQSEPGLRLPVVDADVARRHALGLFSGRSGAVHCTVTLPFMPGCTSQT